MYGIVNERQYVEMFNPITGAVAWTADRERAKRFTEADAALYAEDIGCAFRLDSHQEQ